MALLVTPAFFASRAKSVEMSLRVLRQSECIVESIQRINNYADDTDDTDEIRFIVSEPRNEPLTRYGLGG